MIRFLLTANLAKLAKWLRFLGYDAVLREEMGFDALTTVAARQRRILLTRSRKQSHDPRRFARRLIVSDDHVAQLRELADLLVYDESRVLTRCGVCNQVLKVVDSTLAGVPEHVVIQQPTVRVCRHCGKYYWTGNHEREIRDLLRSVVTVSAASPESPR
jgi:uncharacterized protein